MSIQAGTYQLGPDNAELKVKTGREGKAAKAGHNLILGVESWEGTLEVGEDPAQSRVTLHADGGSLEVLEGTGGVKKLDDSDRQDIKKSIDDEVLEGQAIDFESTEVEATGEDRLKVKGDLTISGTTNSVEFDLSVAEGKVSGSATLSQSDWDIKQYSAMFGALKVTDQVEVVVEGSL